MRTITVALVLLHAALASAVGLGGHSPVPVARTSAIGEGPGPFDGKTYQLGFYLSPLFGYESNYKVTTAQVAGSGLFAAEGGAGFRYRPSSALSLRTELNATLRLPFADTGLTEVLFELPALLYWRFSRRVELALSNHLGLERSKTPPIFLDTTDVADPASVAASGKTIRYFTVYETFRPALALHLASPLLLEAGPYFRIKQVSFIENPYGGEPDYRLYDLGADAALKAWLGERVSLRLRYDFAHRWFANYRARPPAHEPAQNEALAMNRHLLGLHAAVRPWGPLSISAGYNLRLTQDNGGFFSYREHLVSGGVSFELEDRLEVSASVGYLRRDYTRRTPCEAVADPSVPSGYSGSDCKSSDPMQLSQTEEAIIANARVAVTILGWLQAVVSYEFEDASSDLVDLLVPNHRILAGATLSL